VYNIFKLTGSSLEQSRSPAHSDIKRVSVRALILRSDSQKSRSKIDRRKQLLLLTTTSRVRT
jgi:hypothetical protein